MKKGFYYLLAIFCLGATWACTQGGDALFEDSSANRMNKAVEEYREVLTSAPNGWLMEYYAEKEPQKLGGYNLLCRFDKNGDVTLAAEFALSGEGVAKEVRSKYQVIAGQGPMLCFDTYNELIHVFSTPTPSDFNGHEGDFEFVLMEVSPDRILMKGKKNKLDIVLSRNPESLNWSEYLQQVNRMIDATKAYSTFYIELGGVQVGSCLVDEKRLYTFSVGGRTICQNAIYTLTGIKFYRAVELSGRMVRNFRWVADERAYVCEEYPDMKLTFYKAANYLFYEEYIGKYKATYYEDYLKEPIEKEIEIIKKVDNSSYTIKGLMPFNVELSYKVSTGSVAVYSQPLGRSGTNIVVLAIWMVDYPGTFSWDMGYSYRGIWNESEATLSFYHGGEASLDNPKGMILWLFNSSEEEQGEYNSKINSRYIELKLKRLNN